MKSGGKKTGPGKTTAVFFPFALFGSPGASAGAELLADAFVEMLADNRRERQPSRTRAYQAHVRMRELALDNLTAYEEWRSRARRAVRDCWRRGEGLFWITGNHLGVLPVYDELAQLGPDTLVVQFDAHLDVYNLSDCTRELSHGNFLLHCNGPLPTLVNLGHRELLLPPEHVNRYYTHNWSAAELAIDPQPARKRLRTLCRRATRIWVDIDCDVFDPAWFPATAQPVPCGLSPLQLLAWLQEIGPDRLIGVSLSEFDPGRDQRDQCLSTLVWLLEYLLLARYESAIGHRPSAIGPNRSAESRKPKADGR